MTKIENFKLNKLKVNKYSFIENLKYIFNILYYYILFALEFMGIRNPLDNEYIDSTNLPDEVKNDPVLRYVLTKYRYFMFRKHLAVGQRYGEYQTYFYHLNMVASFAANNYKYSYKGEFDVNHFIAIYIAALGHDLIEDARMTYNDVVELFGKEVADIIYACTELKGKNRAERHGKIYYSGLNNSHDGTYVKLNDICANMSNGLLTGHSMFNKYCKDWKLVKEKLNKENFEDFSAPVNDIESLIPPTDELI